MMKERTEQNKRLIEVIKKNEEFLNIKGIERKLGMANGTIGKALPGERSLVYDKEIKIIELLQNMAEDVRLITTNRIKSSSLVRRLYEQACALIRSSRSSRSQ